jgi:hypothetical protein
VDQFRQECTPDSQRRQSSIAPREIRYDRVRCGMIVASQTNAA